MNNYIKFYYINFYIFQIFLLSYNNNNYTYKIFKKLIYNYNKIYYTEY